MRPLRPPRCSLRTPSLVLALLMLILLTSAPLLRLRRFNDQPQEHEQHHDQQRLTPSTISSSSSSAPTSPSPTSLAPTSLSPTSLAPTSSSPTLPPTSLSPMMTPTSLTPTSSAPTSLAPTTTSLSPPIEVVPLDSQPNASLVANVTIVTCFFDLAKVGLTTKHPAEFYLKRGRVGTLALAQPMVIFTDSPVEVATARGQYMHITRIINITLYDLAVYKQFYSQIVDVYPRDLEDKTIFSPQLYSLWYAKPEFIKRAIELDFFHTNKFLYMDVGFVRDGAGIRSSDYIHKPFPAPDREWLVGRGDRVQLQSVGGTISACKQSVRWVEGERPLDVKDVPPEMRVKDAIQLKGRPHRWWMGGGTIGGTKRSLLEFHDTYMHELGRYLAANFTEYTMDDQFLLGALACKYDLIEVIRPPRACCAVRRNRQWMFVLMFYTTDTYPQTDYTEQELVKKEAKARARKEAEERRVAWVAAKAAKKAAKALLAANAAAANITANATAANATAAVFTPNVTAALNVW